MNTIVLLIAITLTAIICRPSITKEETSAYLANQHLKWKPMKYDSNPLKGLSQDQLQSLLGVKREMKSGLLQAPLKVAKQLSTIPASHNWLEIRPSCIHAPRNQGNCGSCWAFSTVGMMEDNSCIYKEDVGYLSAQELVDCSIQNSGCNGGIMSAALEYIAETGGVVGEKCYPYLAADINCPYDCRDGSGALSANKKGKCTADQAEACAGIDGMKSCITYGPLSIAFSVCNSFFYYSSGIYNCDCGTDFVGAHAVVAVGYGSDPECHFIVRNSWGPYWGDSGYFKIACDSCEIADWSYYSAICKYPQEKQTCGETQYMYQEQCIDLCPAGTKPDDAAKTCVLCPPGSYSLAGDPTCTLCPMGEYQNLAGMSECETCGVGRYADTVGSISCTKCPAGTYASFVGQASCDFCPEDQYSSAGSYTCYYCPPGYQPNGINSLCVACPKGTYKELKEGFCVKCPPGQFTNTTANVACLSCLSGQCTNAASTSCSYCAIGYFCSNLACNACPDGYIKNSAVLQNCSICVAGTYSNAGKSACLACAKGSYSLEGSMSCTLCPAGTKAAATKSTSCTQCKPGYYQDLVGQSVCNACPIGTYQSASGATKCLECPSGTKVAQTTCKQEEFFRNHRVMVPRR